MPKATLNSYITSADVPLPGEPYCGYLWATNSSTYTDARNGSDSVAKFSTTLDVATDYNALGGNKYRIKRSFLQFIMPSNFVRCDGDPQLKIRCLALIHISEPTRHAAISYAVV